MKTLWISFLCSVLMPIAQGQFDDSEPASIQVDFPVSRAGADKIELNKIYDAVAKIEISRKNQGVKFKMIQKIDSTHFVANPVIWEEVVGQGGSLAAAGGGGYGRSYKAQRVNTSRKVMVTTIKAREVAEGEMIYGGEFELADKVADIPLPGGDVMSLREWKETKESVDKEFTRESFVVRLKGGETWILKNFAEKPCDDCLGKGDLGTLRSNKKCPACKGKGKRRVDYLVKW